jgi:ubiquinone/menaquinone biosynthesis C-methylase UbiE
LQYCRYRLDTQINQSGAPSKRANGSFIHDVDERLERKMGGWHMAQDWGNRDVARNWDAKGSEHNPSRGEQLDILVTLLEKMMRPNTWMLDLGYGSGQVEKLIFERIPQARIVGVDGSREMMNIAAERLTAYSDRFESIQYNLADFPSLTLPSHPYQFVIAIQSLHHLAREDMQAVYRRIYELLEPGGAFLLLDRMRVENAHVWQVLHHVWQRQDALYQSTVAEHEGESFADHERIVLGRGDYPVLLDEHLAWLKQIGMDAVCVHLHGNRGLVVGVKPE